MVSKILTRGMRSAAAHRHLIVSGVMLVAGVFLGFGLGYGAAIDGDRTPIVIEACAEV